MTKTSSNQICFHTNTKIDPLAWEIIGMSAKEKESTAIGQFGSGLKFAIAILLRTGHQIYIISEGERYDFGTIEKEFRGKKFSIVTCNGNQLGITTDMGKHWDLWMAYRELVSNTMDEGGLHYQGEPMEQGSTIVVQGDAFAGLLAKHDQYFVGDREPLAETPSVNFYRGNGTIFYRGVKVGELEKANYSYELKNHLDLTEDRSIKCEYEVRGSIARAICRELKDRNIIRKIVTLIKDNWEHDLDYDWEWKEDMEAVVKDVWENAPTTLNNKIVRLIRQKIPNTGWDTKFFDKDQQIMLDSAKSFLEKAGYNITADIVFVTNEDTNNIAFVYNGTIHLTKKAFEKGQFYFTIILLEEYFHTIGFDDESRRFESHLLEQIIIHAKRHLKIAL